jgi:hypothetical protein
MTSSDSNISRDIILAGIPRGGTSLACVLLNQLSNTIALNEPLELSQLVSKNETEKIVWLKYQFAQARVKLSRTKSALSKGKGGKLVSNLFSDNPAEDGLRLNIATLQAISFPHFVDSRELSLIIKHPNAFTVLLPLLRDHFECFAVVRNPLAVLLSWNSTRARWQEGFVPVAEKLDEPLHNQLMKAKGIFERQLYILAHYFRIIRESLPQSQVLRYEDIIETGGSALSAICPEAQKLACQLSNLNTNAAYYRSKVNFFTDELLNSPCNWAPFYSKNDILSLSNNLI